MITIFNSSRFVLAPPVKWEMVACGGLTLMTITNLASTGNIPLKPSSQETQKHIWAKGICVSAVSPASIIYPNTGEVCMHIDMHIQPIQGDKKHHEKKNHTMILILIFQNKVIENTKQEMPTWNHPILNSSMKLVLQFFTDYNN